MVYQGCQFMMRTALNNRANGNWGILVREDYWALLYQKHFYEAQKAKEILSGPGLIAMFTSNDPGINDRESEARFNAMESMNRQRREERSKLAKAKRLLRWFDDWDTDL